MGDQHKRKLTGLRLPPELLDELDEWCSDQRPPVTRTAVIQMLLEDFLTARRSEGWQPAKTSSRLDPTLRKRIVATMKARQKRK